MILFQRPLMWRYSELKIHHESLTLKVAQIWSNSYQEPKGRTAHWRIRSRPETERGERKDERKNVYVSLCRRVSWIFYLGECLDSASAYTHSSKGSFFSATSLSRHTAGWRSRQLWILTLVFSRTTVYSSERACACI